MRFIDSDQSREQIASYDANAGVELSRGRGGLVNHSPDIDTSVPVSVNECKTWSKP